MFGISLALCVPPSNVWRAYLACAVQSVVKMTGHKGQVPWQETLTQNREPNWKVLMLLMLAAHFPCSVAVTAQDVFRKLCNANMTLQ